MKYDVFISYRREGGYDTAKHLYDLLVRDGYKVSFDIDTLRNGDFDTQLLDRIEQCKDFILVVDTHAFDRTLDPTFEPQKDWLRCELAHALKHKRNIIPVFLSGESTFPEGLPEDIAGVVKKHGPEYNRFYFDDFYKRLKVEFLRSKKHGAMKLVCLIILLMFIILGILLFFHERSKYRERMLAVIENIIDSEPSLGGALLCEALPEGVRNEHHYNIMLPIERMNTTEIVWTGRAFDDECVAIDDSAHYIATSLYGDEVIIRDLANINDESYLCSSELGLLGGRCCAFGTTPNKLALGYIYGYEYSVILFDIDTNKEVKRYKLNSSFDKLVYGNKYLVAYGHSGLEILSLEQGMKFSLKDFGAIKNVKFPPKCDSIIYVVSDDDFLSVYDIEKQGFVDNVRLGKSWRYPMCFSEDGTYLYVGIENAIYKFNSQSLSLIDSKIVSYATISSIKILNNETLICGDVDGNIYQCDSCLNDLKVLPSKHESRVEQMAINQKGEIVSYSNGLVLKTYGHKCDVVFSALHKGDLACSYVIPEDSTVLIGDSDGQLLIYEKHDYYTVKIAGENVRDKSINKINRFDENRFLVFADEQIALFDLLKGVVIDNIYPEEGYIEDMSCADSSIYITSYDNYISSYIIRNNKITENNRIYGESHDMDIDCVLYLPQKGIMVYSVGNQLYKYLTYSAESTLIGTATDDIKGIIIHPRKELLYLVCDRTIECFSLNNSNKCQFKLDIGISPNRIAVSNDGRFILTGDYDGEVNVWSALSGVHIKRVYTDFVIGEIYFKEQSDELYLLTQNRGLVKMTLFEDMNAFLKNKENHRRLTDDEKRTYSISPIFSRI